MPRRQRFVRATWPPWRILRCSASTGNEEADRCYGLGRRFLNIKGVNMLRSIVRGVIAAGAGLGLLLSCGVAAADGDDGGGRHETATPIKHLIVLIGENWTFDAVYGT